MNYNNNNMYIYIYIYIEREREVAHLRKWHVWCLLALRPPSILRLKYAPRDQTRSSLEVFVAKIHPPRVHPALGFQEYTIIQYIDLYI